MKPERWQEIKEMVKEQFDVVYEGEEDLDPLPGSAEVIEFDGPQGSMRLEFVSKPKQVGRKVHTSTRIGGDSNEEILFSEDELVHHLVVLRFDEDEDDWVEVKNDLFS